MFSRENRRFTLLIFAGVLVITLTIAGVINLIDHEHSNNVYLLTAFSCLIITQIFTMARTEQATADQRRNAIKAEEARTEISNKVDEIKQTVAETEKKTNGNLTKAIETTAKAVKAAALTPAPGQEQMPRTIGELESLLKLFSREICREFVERSKVDAERVAKTTIEKTREEVAAAAKETVRVVIEELLAHGVIHLPKSSEDGKS